jgi:serine/threonine protein kinase
LSMSQQDHKDFFISYNGADQRWAEWIAWQLEEAAYSVILQAWDFLPGSNFVVQMDRALTLAPRLVAVLSPQYLSSLYTQPEWAAAFRHDPKGEQSLLIPVRVQRCEVTGLLGPIVYVDLVGRDEATARQRLLAAVRHERAKPAQAPAFPQTMQHTISKQLNFPGDLPPIWKMPHQRDPLFLGREPLLQELHSSLATDHTVLLFEPAHEREAGNSGATSTAVEYAYRFRSDYQVIAWIQADSREALRADLLSLATALHLPQANPPDQDPLLAVVQWLRTHQHWLLVLDRVHEKEVLSPLMPLPKSGHLLVVTATRSLESAAPLIELNQVPWEERTVLTQLSQVVGAALQGPEGRIALGLEPITIGRASTNQVVLRDPSVSSRHAIIALKDQAYWITDTESTNGTLLNQQRLVPQVPLKLHPGDAIRFGNITCTYGVMDRPSRSLASPLSSEQENTSAGASPLSPPIIERQQHDRVGQRFGNYRLSRLIGQGGFAEVYLGEHIFLDTQTAIKVLYTQLVGQDVEQFRQEARTIAHLEHPHIVRLLDFGVEGTTPYLIMSYAPNGTMRERYPKGTRLPLEQVVFYVKQISQALQYAHDRKIIHRDVKPENMLFGPDDQVVLSDFGIAQVTQSSRYQRPNDMAGTIAYMAPEQIEAHPRPASDQYSLGIVIYEWLCGERPFHGSFTEIAVKQQLVAPASLREKVPGLSSDVEQVVMTALAKDPKGRFGSMRALATALEQAILAVQDVPSVQLNNMALFPPQDASTVPDPLMQHAPGSSQTEIEQEQPLLKAPEPLRGNGEARGEVPPQIHADGPSPLGVEKETVPPASNLILNSPQAQAGAYDSLNAGRSGTEISTAKISDKKVKPWGLGKRQMIALVVGIVTYSVVDYLILQLLVASYHGDYTLFNPLFLNISWANILLGLVVVVPLLFATKFGPWVGLACFLLGSLIADSFSQARTDFEIPWYTYASLALLGFLSGLAFLRTQGYYHTRRNIATAVILSFIGLVVDALFFMIVDINVNPSSWFDSFSFYLKSALISILALMVLAIMLIISNKIERRNIPTG